MHVTQYSPYCSESDLQIECARLDCAMIRDIKKDKNSYTMRLTSAVYVN